MIVACGLFSLHLLASKTVGISKSWHVSRACPSLILSVSVYRPIVQQFVYSFLERADTVSMQLFVAIDFRVLLPTALILSLLVCLLIFVKVLILCQQSVPFPDLLLSQTDPRGRNKRWLLLKLSINHSRI